MHGCHTKTLEVRKGCGVCNTKELIGMRVVGYLVGEVAHVQFINHLISRREECRTLILRPSDRVGSSPVDDGGAFAIHANGRSKDAGRFATPDVERIELSLQIALQGECPTMLSRRSHLILLQRFAPFAISIKPQCRLLRRIQRKGGLMGLQKKLIEETLSLRHLQNEGDQ